MVGNRSATIIARAAEQQSSVRGLRVLPTATGWQVVLPTGATHLVQSVNALARVAQVDPTTASAVYLNESADEPPVLDRRRTITIRAAYSDEPLPVGLGTWPDTLLSSEITVVAIDSTSSTRLLRELEVIAQTVSQAPYRDHLRMLPITAELMQRVEVHHWADLPDQIGAEGLPALCLSVAARLVLLPATDANFREALVALRGRGTVRIQSVGSTVTAIEVTQSSR